MPDTLTASGTYDGADVDRIRVAATFTPADGVTPPASWAVERLAPTRRPVRGFAAPAGALSVTADDWEVSPGPNRYLVTVQPADPAAAPLSTVATVSVPDVAGRPDWLKNPARPPQSMPIHVEYVGDPKRAAVTDMAYPVNAAYPVTAIGTRQAPTFTLGLFTLDGDERAALLALLDAPNPLLFTAPTSRLPEGAVWLVAGTFTESRLGRYGGNPERRFTVECTEVAPPDDLEVVGGRGITWQTVLDNHATWADVLAARVSWLDVLERG